MSSAPKVAMHDNPVISKQLKTLMMHTAHLCTIQWLIELHKEGIIRQRERFTLRQTGRIVAHCAAGGLRRQEKASAGSATFRSISTRLRFWSHDHFEQIKVEKKKQHC